MELWQKIISKFVESKSVRYFTYLTLLLCVFIFIAFMFDKCSIWKANKQIEKGKSEINALTNNANSLANDLQNLKIKEAEKQKEVEFGKNNLNQATNNRINAQINTNKALENINAIESSNSKEKTLQEANKARCKVFPNSKECN